MTPVAAALLLLGAFATPAAAVAGAQGPTTSSPAARAEFLAVRLDTSSGAVEADILDAAGRRIHTARAPELRLDAVPQTGFTATGAAAARNPTLDVTLEVLGPRAIAVTWTSRDGAVHDFALRLRSDDETRYYGTGERFNALNQRGYALPLITDDRYGNKGVGSYKPIPFFMSSRGFGVWVDSWAPGHFDLSATERFMSTLRFPETRLRVVFLAGPDLADILEAFTGLTGRPPVPPPWAFGLWKSRDIHHNADSVYSDVERLREHGIPSSVLVLDSPWETGYNTFEINRVQFPDPEAMFSRVRELGFEVALWLTPFVNDSKAAPAPERDMAWPGSASQIAVNAGSHYQYVDRTGVAWEADRPYAPGSWGFLGGEARLAHHRIAGTAEDGLFQATREGAVAYRFDVPDGPYEVRLLFGETGRWGPGERVFEVRINGAAALPPLDLAREPGAYRAVDRKLRARAVDGAGLTLELVPSAGRATISGIAIRGL